MRTMRLALMILLAFISFEAFGQNFYVGTPYREELANFSSFPFSGPRTWLDLSRAANASGTIYLLKYGWEEPGCTSVVNVVFLRNLGDELVVFEKRGPFDGPQTGRAATIQLNPPVNIRQGDVIGLTQLTPCGSPAFQLEPSPLYGPSGSELFPFEVTGRLSLELAERTYGRLMLHGWGTAHEQLMGVIPVAISGPGAFGSSFTTSVQIHNPFPREIVNGRLVFHPAGRVGSSDDSSVRFALGPGETRNFPDIVAAIGATGIGSIDIVTDLGPTGSVAANSATRAPGPKPLTQPTPLPSAAPPATTVRIDAASSATPGRFGLAENMVQVAGGFHSDGVLSVGAIGVLATPADLEGFRMNIGVRTLFAGATVVFTAFDSSGERVGKLEHRFPSTWFEQMDAASFIGVPVPQNGSIHVHVFHGAAIVYGATVNNVTQDGSLQFARHLNGGLTALAGTAPP